MFFCSIHESFEYGRFCCFLSSDFQQKMHLSGDCTGTPWLFDLQRRVTGSVLSSLLILLLVGSFFLHQVSLILICTICDPSIVCVHYTHNVCTNTLIDLYLLLQGFSRQLLLQIGNLGPFLPNN